MEFNYFTSFSTRQNPGVGNKLRALTRPFSLSEAEYAEMGVACETTGSPTTAQWGDTR